MPMTTPPEYAEYRPHPLLASLIDCYWSCRVLCRERLSARKPVIPDGCVDIIFDLEPAAPLRCFVVGAMTKPVQSRKTNLFGVRFHTAMATSLFKTPMHHFTDLMVDACDALGDPTHALSDQLAEKALPQDRVALLNEEFLRRLADCSPPERPLAEALRLIHNAGGQCSVQQVSTAVGWSRQHFTRRCLHDTGLSPKFLMQVVRLHQTIALHKKGGLHGWCHLSQEGGYFDQSHMIREFKGITGLTPAEYFSPA
ncbi:helix-turn-helix domain-containing protein [Desulfoluna butyratoxydans]|uniref:Dna binding hth domain arac-type n=1 Tax=Desulfoluna butyratoxydans TaxID=231438 RepID=A0A4U8YRA1_9BACT|nr:AraC family transcriptional regulator [Desulfoluna butyratoxydans]VFQ46816.1 dna binding hth domain arac-type [Desulfoluna butyratoxydans]